MKKRATLAELREALMLLCERYPEVADREVCVSTDSGYAGAHITSPIKLYGYVGDRETINIYSNDDIDLEYSENVVCYFMDKRMDTDHEDHAMIEEAKLNGMCEDVLTMDKFISKEAVLSKCDDIWNDADETTQTGVDTINTIDKITDFIESLPNADVEPVDRWIDAQKNPPPIVDRRSMTSESVLILRDNGRCAVAYYCYDAEDGYYWTTDDEKTMYAWEEVTHWQPLPKVPKEDNTNE